MTVTEALQLANELVFAQTGKHLDDLQEEVIKGLWQGQTYNKIAEESNRSESRVKDIGHKLLHILSEQLGEDVKKSNFRSTIERLKVTSSPSSQVGINQNFNFCSQSFHNNTKELLLDKLSNTSTIFHDLTIAPKITYFYDRTTELNTLSHWLIDQNTRLTSVLGLSGIGKTTLVKQFVDLNLQHFDIIIWKNLKLSLSLDSILTEILTRINPDSVLADNKLTQILNLFRDQKCLIILDDVQELFIKEKLAGQYKSEYRDYQTFLTMITETEHKSSLILISQEKCQEMISLDDSIV
jgi:hypothetical protein